jgi:hypothetical protein
LIGTGVIIKPRSDLIHYFRSYPPAPQLELKQPPATRAEGLPIPSPSLGEDSIIHLPLLPQFAEHPVYDLILKAVASQSLPHLPLATRPIAEIVESDLMTAPKKVRSR